MQTKPEATIEDLYHAPDDGKYELIDGELVKMPPTGDEPGYVADEIFVSLRAYVRRRKEGRARGDGVAFVVDLPRRRSFSPDASFSAVAPRKRSMKFIEGAPTFAVEVRSEHDYGPAMDRAYARKRADYFAAGTAVVWDVDPIARTVKSYRRDDPERAITFGSGETAHAKPALPDWFIAVDDLFSDDVA